MSIEIPTNETDAEIEKHTLKAEPKIRKWSN